MSIFGWVAPWWGRWAVLALLMLACIAFGAAKMHAHDEKKYDKLNDEYVLFKSQVKANGEIALKAKATKEKADKDLKEQADAENIQTIASLNATVKRLRNDRAASSFVPREATNTGSPEIASFDKAKLERAIRDFDQSLQRIIDQCSETTINLDTAKLWAKK